MRGFTLIELLVVIAIIGLLASVVMASLSSARTKGRDAAIRSSVLQMVNTLELHHTDVGSYTALQAGWDTTVANCNNSFSGTYAASMRQMCIAIINAGGTLHTGNNQDNANKYSVMGYLPGKARYFCAGSSGGRSDTETGDNWLDSGCYANP